MSALTSRHLVFAAIGFGAGTVSAFLGIGGGALLVPLLMLVLGLPFKEAVGTSLATVIVISTVGVGVGLALHPENVQWLIVIVLTVGSLVGSWIGDRMLRTLPDRVLRIGFAGLLVLAGLRLVATPAAAASGAIVLDVVSSPGHVVMVGLVGVIAGVTSVLFGLGGGVVIVPALLALFPHTSFAVIAATSLATVIPTSLLSVVPHVKLGTIDRRLVACLAPLGVMGAVAGVLVGNTLPVWPCRLLFAVFLGFVVLRLLTGRRASAVQKPNDDMLPDVAALAAKLRALPESALSEIHRIAAPPLPHGAPPLVQVP